MGASVELLSGGHLNLLRMAPQAKAPVTAADRAEIAAHSDLMQRKT
jgi:hypothetical protein